MISNRYYKISKALSQHFFAGISDLAQSDYINLQASGLILD